MPVPIYPLLPMENPAAYHLAAPPKSAFCVQVLVEGSYSQKSFVKVQCSSLPVPIYPLLPMENPPALALARSPEVGFLCPGIGGRIIFPEIFIKC